MELQDVLVESECPATSAGPGSGPDQPLSGS